MASWESSIATRLRADATLMATLTGGVYADGTLGIEGITNPTTTPGAYTSGALKPCAIVRERAAVPGRRVVDLAAGVADAVQVVEVHLYERGGATAIRTAMSRIFALLHGWKPTGAWPLEWDGGAAVMDASEFVGVRTARADYRIVSLRGT